MIELVKGDKFVSPQNTFTVTKIIHGPEFDLVKIKDLTGNELSWSAKDVEDFLAKSENKLEKVATRKAFTHI